MKIKLEKGYRFGDPPLEAAGKLAQDILEKYGPFDFTGKAFVTACGEDKSRAYVVCTINIPTLGKLNKEKRHARVHQVPKTQISLLSNQES